MNQNDKAGLFSLSLVVFGSAAIILLAAALIADIEEEAALVHKIASTCTMRGNCLIKNARTKKVDTVMATDEVVMVSTRTGGDKVPSYRVDIMDKNGKLITWTTPERFYKIQSMRDIEHTYRTPVVFKDEPGFTEMERGFARQN